ncbi:MAG: MFS transporter [Planctomycetota bacterium]|nr:MFS transporter [Planctomycetota bacterium]
MPDDPPPHPERPPARLSPYAALASTNYRFFAGGFLLSSCGLQMHATALGWEIYELTHDPFYLGLAGLARALPVILLALPAGHIIDHLSRRRVLVATQAAMGVAIAILAFASGTIEDKSLRLWTIYAMLVLVGAARSFNGPSRASLLPLIVRPTDFSNAVTWNSGIFQLSATVGPVLAGLMLARAGEAWPVYACSAAGCFLFAVFASNIRPIGDDASPGRFSLRSMTAGAGHVWREKTILGTITLDLFAVLLGGATALMPVYAKDILRVGPEGLGMLRAAPYVGAFVMALVLAHRPPFTKSGRALFLSVAGFGACTILFGFCGEFPKVLAFPVALGALAVAGALDNISVVIRHILVQVRTPNHLRGRVSSVNSVFIESSNEIGAFESGLVAKFFGPVVSVVSGGIGTLVVVGAIAAAFPALRRLGRLELGAPHDPAPGEAPVAPAPPPTASPAQRTRSRPGSAAPR